MDAIIIFIIIINLYNIFLDILWLCFTWEIRSPNDKIIFLILWPQSTGHHHSKDEPPKKKYNDNHAYDVFTRKEKWILKDAYGSSSGICLDGDNAFLYFILRCEEEKQKKRVTKEADQ